MSRATGIARELKVVRLLRSEGWAAWTTKNDGVARPGQRTSHGPVDVIAVRFDPATSTREVRLIQVKTTAGGPYERFGPVYRKQLLDEARLSGAEAWLCWWPPNGGATWIVSHAWPI